jgi:UDP:flavonoid glycosyltransferase YjiC (YdhE family)
VTRRILLVTFGSYGDLNPFIGLAEELNRRGHHAILASNWEWRNHVENAGIEFRPVRPGWDVNLDPNDYESYLATNGVFTDFRASYEDLLTAVRDVDALGTLTLAAAGPLVARKTGLPWASVVLEPLSFFSQCEPLIMPDGLSLPKMKQFTFGYAEPVQRLRGEVGIPAGLDPFLEEYLTADLVLGLFSRFLATRQPDWPRNTVVTGFVPYDQVSEKSEVPAALQTFLESGEPPVVFTISSDAANSPVDHFYDESIRSAQALGCRAVLLGLGLHQQWDRNILCVERAPFSRVFPYAAAVVHHGGVGTTAIALRAGSPMLVVPGSFAQPDTAARLVRLGVARAVPRSLYSAAVVVPELWRLLADPAYRSRAQAIAPQVAAEDGASKACDAMEQLLRTRHSLARGAIS